MKWMEVIERSLRSSLPISQLFCESWMFMKENPDNIKKVNGTNGSDSTKLEKNNLKMLKNNVLILYRPEFLNVTEYQGENKENTRL